jgi:hypothetical protein
MKSLVTKCGLSARQRTINKRKQISLRTNPLGIFLIVVVLILSSCHEKTNGQNAEAKNKSSVTASHDSLNKPKVNIQVSRRYDDKGNLIGFDSTYSSYYSNVAGDTAQMDSLMSALTCILTKTILHSFAKNLAPCFLTIHCVTQISFMTISL